MNTIKIDKQGVRMIAHRGVSGLETENTLAAFIAAGNRSYWGIETDVHVTADGNLILIHDSNTARVADREMVVEESLFEDLRALQVKDRYHNDDLRGDLCLPSLEEYIRICKKYEKEAILELKEAFALEDIKKVIQVFRAEDYLDHVVFISFCLQNLIYVRGLLPDCRAQYIMKKITETEFEAMKQYRLDLDMDCRKMALTREWIDRMHGEGLRVNGWTVDNAADAQTLISWGIDYITTNILE